MNRANGDTAKPKSRYSDDHYESARVRARFYPTYALYSLREYSEFAPYARYRKDGQVIRIETDGKGGLVEYVESFEPKCYGVPRIALYVSETSNRRTLSHRSIACHRARLKRLRAITRWVTNHPDVTKRDVADQFEISTAQAWHDLNLLKQWGRLIDTPQQSADGRKANYTWGAT